MVVDNALELARDRGVRPESQNTSPREAALSAAVEARDDDREAAGAN